MTAPLQAIIEEMRRKFIDDLAADLTTDLRVNGFGDVPDDWFEIVIRQHIGPLADRLAALLDGATGAEAAVLALQQQIEELKHDLEGSKEAYTIQGEELLHHIRLAEAAERQVEELRGGKARRP